MLFSKILKKLSIFSRNVFIFCVYFYPFSILHFCFFEKNHAMEYAPQGSKHTSDIYDN